METAQNSRVERTHTSHMWGRESRDERAEPPVSPPSHCGVPHQEGASRVQYVRVGTRVHVRRDVGDKPEGTVRGRMHVRLRQAPSRLIDLVDRSCARAGTFLREDDSEEEGSAHSRASVASAKGAALATRTRAHATRVGVPAGAPAVALQDSRGPLTVLWGGSRRSYRAPRGGGHAHTQSAVPGGLPLERSHMRREGDPDRHGAVPVQPHPGDQGAQAQWRRCRRRDHVADWDQVGASQGTWLYPPAGCSYRSAGGSAARGSAKCACLLPLILVRGM